MSDSYIGVNKATGQPTSFVGSDAVELYRVAVLKSAIGLLQKGIAPTRGYTMKKALAAATAVTKKPYKRTEAEQAKADLQLWLDAMKLALPVIES